MPTASKPITRSFASDNNAGVHPEVLAAMAAANTGHSVGYGDDVYTERARAKAKEVPSIPVAEGARANRS